MLFINILNFCLFVDCRNSKRISQNNHLKTISWNKKINNETTNLPPQSLGNFTSNIPNGPLKRGTLDQNDTIDLDLTNTTLDHRNISAYMRADLNHSSVNNNSVQSDPNPPHRAISSVTVIPPNWMASNFTSSSLSDISTEIAPSTSDGTGNAQKPTLDKLNMDLPSTIPNFSASPIKVANPDLVSSASLDSNAQDSHSHPAIPLLDTISPSLVASSAGSVNNNDVNFINNHVPAALIGTSSGTGKSNPSSNHPEYVDGNTTSSWTQRNNTSTYIVIAGTGSLFLVGVGMLALYEKKSGRFSSTPPTSLYDGDLSFRTSRESMISQLESGLEQPIPSDIHIHMPPLRYIDSLDPTILYHQDDPSNIYAELHRASLVESILEPGPAYVPGRIFGNSISATQASWSDAFMEELTGFESESMNRPPSLSSQNSDESEDIKHLVHYLDIKHIIDMELN